MLAKGALGLCPHCQPLMGHSNDPGCSWDAHSTPRTGTLQAGHQSHGTLLTSLPRKPQAMRAQCQPQASPQCSNSRVLNVTGAGQQPSELRGDPQALHPHLKSISKSKGSRELKDYESPSCLRSSSIGSEVCTGSRGRLPVGLCCASPLGQGQKCFTIIKFSKTATFLLFFFSASATASTGTALSCKPALSPV